MRWQFPVTPISTLLALTLLLALLQSVVHTAHVHTPGEEGHVQIPGEIRCGQDYIEQERRKMGPLPSVSVNHVKVARLDKKRNVVEIEHVWGGLRIMFDLRYLSSDQEGVQTLKGKIIPKAASELKKLLHTRSVDGNLKINAMSCGTGESGVQVPQEHRDPGISDTDVVIYITSRPTKEGIIGWAMSCVRENTFDRPIAGLVNLSPSLFFKLPEDTQLGTVIHEVMHVLGYDPLSFTYFRDENGERRNTGEVIKEVVKTHNGHKQTFSRLISPNVVREIRRQSGCETIEGMDLVEFGEGGTIGSHVNALVAVNDVMIATNMWYNPGLTWVVSRLTLAVFEDSGWYRPDYSMAKDLVWGANMGCNFLEKRCEDWNTNRPGYFCDNSAEHQCTYDLRGKGMCVHLAYDKDLGFYSHLRDRPTIGGQPFLQYCPIVHRIENVFCDNEQSPLVDPGETYSATSGCFESNIVNWYDILGIGATRKTRCLAYRCNDEEKVVSFRVDDKWTACPTDQSEKTFEFGGFLSFEMRGYVKCPPRAYDILCSKNLPSRPAGSSGAGSTFALAGPGAVLLTTVVVVLALILAAALSSF